jgi:hypothetical protein
MSERRGKLYNDRECRSVEWERAVAGTEHIHSTFIILNVLYRVIEKSHNPEKYLLMVTIQYNSIGLKNT